VFIDGCFFENHEVNAINAYGTGNTLRNTFITNNSITDCNNTSGAAIAINNADGINISGNQCGPGLLNFKPAYLMEFFAGTTGIYCAGNLAYVGVTTGVINDQSGATAKTIVNNPGYNPIAAFNVSLPAAPNSYTYTNSTGAPVTAILMGGTVTSPFVNSITLSGLGVTVGNSMSLVVPQGESLYFAYTAAGTPTLNVYGM
jgi:hypothetical protein